MLDPGVCLDGLPDSLIVNLKHIIPILVFLPSRGQIFCTPVTAKSMGPYHGHTSRSVLTGRTTRPARPLEIHAGQSFGTWR
jgi:hypothetical protein